MKLTEAQDSYLDRVAVYTDYPIQSLGDIGGIKAPMRKAYILNMPQDKYADLLVVDKNKYGFAEVKIGYIERAKDEV